MLATYFILKLTFQAILEECNRAIIEGEKNEKARWLKSRAVKLDIDFSSGLITEAEYATRQEELLRELRGLGGGPKR